MPDRPAAERTEQPTPERLRKAREEGQVPQSQEAPSALMVAAMLVVAVLAAEPFLRWSCAGIQQGLTLRLAGPMTVDGFCGLLGNWGWQAMMACSPFLLAAAGMSVLGSLLSSGWTFAPKVLALKFDRISPVQGFKNLISLRSFVQLLLSLVKLTVVLAIVWVYLRGRLDEVLALQWLAPAEMLRRIAGLVLGVGGRIVVALMAIACVDLLYQRWNHRRELRMTRQEVKEERRQYELPPEVKSRIRSIQIAMTRKRMLQEVPKADVVLVNPTHVAVALKYDPGAMDRPVVVAKGAELLCEKIKDIARANNVPVIHRPELARTLYAGVEVGQAIPEMLFVAVAEVLAMIYRLRRRRLTR